MCATDVPWDRDDTYTCASSWTSTASPPSPLTTRSSRSVRSTFVNIFCSTDGSSPRSAGRIHIWMNRMGSVSEAFCSECQDPLPSVMRCTEPAGSTCNESSRPRLSACLNEPSTTYVIPSMSLCGCIGHETPGTNRSSLNTRSDPNCVHSGSRY